MWFGGRLGLGHVDGEFAALAGPAFAQQPGVPVPGAQAQVSGPADVRVNQLIIYGDDACPESTDPNEITVCARFPDADRYRVPPSLRDNPNEPVGKLNGTFAGVNGLMDKLVAMGFVPEEQMMGMRMMLAMFAKPVDGQPDQLTSEIEFREGGSIFANGQQVK